MKLIEKSLKEKSLLKFRLLILADSIKNGVGLTPEQLGCREREEARTRKPQYNIEHYNNIINRAKSL